MSEINEVLSDESNSAVQGGNLLSFFSEVSREDKRFIKNSMRWAEHNADLRFNRKLESANWFEFYSGQLWSVGWGLEHEPVIVSEKSIIGDVVEIWAKSLSTLLSREKVRAMKASFQLLEFDPAAIEVFTSSTRKFGDFRFSPAQYNRYTELEIVISNVRLLSSEWASTYLFWNLQHNGSQLDIQSRRFVIKPAQIDKYRERLNAAVAELRVKEIELAG